MKFSKIKFGFISLLIAVTLFFTSFSAFATSDLEDASETESETVIESESAPASEETTDAESESHSDGGAGEPDSSGSGEAESRRPETKPNSTTETKRHSGGSGGNAGRDDRNDYDPGDSGDDDSEDDGKFTVYIELNNGEERMKFDLEEEGVVPEPQSKPQRKGFKFAGWFSDPEFKTAWDFSKDVAKKGTVIYVKWVPDEGTVLHKITVSQLTGGTLEANPPSAAKGETVNITVKPENGKRLKAGSLLINGEVSDFLSFVMPGGDVVLSAEFEDVPKKAEEKSNKKLVIIICVIAAAVVAAAVSFFAIKKKRADDSDGDAWVDDSIKLQDGFKDGRVVKPEKDDGTIVIGDDDDGTVILSSVDDIVDPDD